jgi:AcrR family transcriptional regulator
MAKARQSASKERTAASKERTAAPKDSAAAPRERAVRLDAAAWVAAALDVLADGGIDAVSVEPLAKTLGVTKGSFYWHFADRRALLDAMLQAWMEGRVVSIRQQAAERNAPAVVLRELADLFTRRANIRGLTIELAIRSFARTDERAAQAVHTVDRERLQRAVQLFVGLGWPRAKAQSRGILFYSYLFGQSLLDPQVVSPAEREKAIEAFLTALP